MAGPPTPPGEAHLPLAPTESPDEGDTGGGGQPIVPWSPPPFFAEFRLVRMLGQGGMGVVWLGHDTLLARPVAVKFIASKEPDATARERFLVEARAIARLTHPNVVTIYRLGEVEGRPYIVSELVRGQSLAELQKPVPWQRALKLGVGLARGLGAAHRQKVLHRDIKPGNIMVQDGDEVKLLDFGLAKLVDSLLSSEEGDPTGAIVGTPRYMAPEVRAGEPATRRSDIYSLGLVLYELCAGRPPVAPAGEAPPLLHAAPGVDGDFANLIDRCLQLDPSQRFASGDELREALERFGPASGALPLPEGNPYRGLSPFEAQHRALFFGRSTDIQAVLDRLRTEPLVLIAGDSGVGKSSLCRAGVLPRITEGSLDGTRAYGTVTMVPGRRPVAALTAAMAPVLGMNEEALGAWLRQNPAALGKGLRAATRQGTGTLLFVDQMEELLTISEPAEAALMAEILGDLAAPAPGIRLLLTVRGDFLTRLAMLPGVGEEVQRALYLLRPLSAEGAREAVVGPARSKGVSFESDVLVQELVRAEAQGGGGLPLLEFALTELWEARDLKRQVIPKEALRSIGGVAGALSRHADGVLAGLLSGQRAAAQRILGKLVTAEGTRSRRAMGELIGQEEGERVALEALVRGRLLVAREAEGEATYEVAHEALVAGWGTLREWLAGGVEQRAMRERIEAAAAEWARLERAREALWSERQLAEVETVNLEPEDLGPREAFFLNESRGHARRQQRVRRGLLLGLPLVLGLVALLGVERRRSGEYRQKAEEIAQAELGLRAMRMVLRPGQDRAALAMGVKAMAPSVTHHRSPPVQAVEGLSAALSVARRSLVLSGHQAATTFGWYSPDGMRVVTPSQDHTARIWDASSGRSLATLQGHTAEVNGARFSPDGKLVLTSSTDGTARLWDGQTGRPAVTLTGHTGEIWMAAFSPNGARLITASADRTARLWDARTGQLQAILRGHLDKVIEARFSPDGRHIATRSFDLTVRLWDGRSGAPRKVLSGHTNANVDAVFSPDSKRLATTGFDRTVRLWDVGTGEPTAVLEGHTGGVRKAAFSPDGLRLATASQDKTVRIWNVSTGRSLAVLDGHTADVWVVSFSPDGRYLATGGVDTSVRLWDAKTYGLLAVLRGHEGQVSFVMFSPDGRHLLTSALDARPRVWDVQDQFVTLSLSNGAIFGEFSSNGTRIVSVSADSRFSVWDARTASPLRTIQASATAIVARLSRDGNRLITRDRNATVLWDAASGQHLASFTGSSNGRLSLPDLSSDGSKVVVPGPDAQVPVMDVRSGHTLLTLREQLPTSMASFSPDGTRIVIAQSGARPGDDLAVHVWDARTGQLVLSLNGHRGPGVTWAEFSRDGRRIVTAGEDGTARLWDAQNGRLLLTLRGHEGPVNDVQISPDGSRLLTASDDGTVRLWDVRTGQMVALCHEGPVGISSASFSPDGARIVMTDDHELRIFPTPPPLQEAVALGCQLLRYQPELEQVKHECQPFLEEK